MRNKVFKKNTFIIAVALFLSGINTRADDYVSDEYAQDYSYNIVSASTWNIAPYLFAGYSFGWVPYYNSDNADYGYMLRNGHSGFILGTGITINRNWKVGISFQRLTRDSELRSYSKIYPEIDHIESEVLLTNIDFSMRLPINTRKDLFNLHIVSGFNIIVANLANKYKSGVDTIPVGLAKDMHKAGLGMNVGVALTYRIIGGLHIKAEGRRMFVLTRKTSLIRDSWLMNVGIGLDF